MSTSAHKWLVFCEIKQVDLFEVSRQGKLKVTALLQLKVKHGCFMIQQIEPFKIDHEVGWGIAMENKNYFQMTFSRCASVSTDVTLIGGEDLDT